MEATVNEKKRFRLRIPSFLKRWDSLFYFAIVVILISFFHVIYALVMNHFATMYSWDYSVQFIPFAYDFYDDWKAFFSTGHFPLYSTRVFLGTDNIGSNAYYSLLDPFLIPAILFPRDFIPQYFVFATSAKFLVTTFAMRAYLKYMGVGEWMSRLGGIAVAFSGYAHFMIGFPTTISALVYLPMLLYGLEKLIREQKPFWVVLAVFLEGITSAFMLVTLCIFGAFYAVWRFFATIKQRDKKTNGLVMLMGVAAFAIGLCLCAFVVLPSIRQATLTGRTSSIGGAYLEMLKQSIKSRDFRSFFALMFEEVGHHPGREVIAFTSFFFPTGGFVAMPWARSGYDAWTASIFCYTPFLILFFIALCHSMLQRKWQHFLAIFLCAALFLTQFSHFAFYAFTGNGYGRWYFVLIPLIVYYGCWGFEQRKKTNYAVPILGTLLAFGSSLFAYFFMVHILQGNNFVNTNGMTYWQSSYVTPDQHYQGLDTPWFLYYQIGWMIIEGFVLIFGHRKKWAPHLLMGSMMIEIIVMGNLVFVYNGLLLLDSKAGYNGAFAGGSDLRETTSYIVNGINGQDSSFFRTYSDTVRTKYQQHVGGFNGASDFHSLMNFAPETFALHNQMKKPGGTNRSYETTDIYNPNWSGAYAHKRFSTDYLLGFRYYVEQNDYSGWASVTNQFFPQPNVPFGAVEVESVSPNRNRYRIYRVPETVMPSLGFAVGDNELFRLGRSETSHYQTSFFTYYGGKSSFRELSRIEEVQIRGAMIEDNDVLPEEFNIKTTNNTQLSAELNRFGVRIMGNKDGYVCDYYETAAKDGFFAATNQPYFQDGPGYFLNHYESVAYEKTGRLQMLADRGKAYIHPSTGTYFNASKEGCYIEIKTYPVQRVNGITTPEYNRVPRIYAIGDYEDENHVEHTNAVLAYEYYSLDNARRIDSYNNYYNSTSATFGLYCRGKVKGLAFCYGGSGSIGLSLDNLFITCTDYVDWKAKVDPLARDGLKNVQYSTDKFTFETAYDRKRIVKTQLGYDEGWSVVAHVPGEGDVNCQMLRLDGGLVGFAAPFKTDTNGDPVTITYTMTYLTPYAKFSAAAWVGGMVLYSGYALTSFLLRARKRKKELELTAPQSRA